MREDTTEYGDGLVDVSRASLGDLARMDSPALTQELRRYLNTTCHDAEPVAGFTSYIDNEEDVTGTGPS
jgi:FXSXX-COOH protein